MRLLIPIGSFYPDISGGPSLTMYWLANALGETGIEISVITTNRGIGDSIAPDCWHKKSFGQVKYVTTSRHNLPFKLFIEALGAVGQHNVIYLTSFFYPLSFSLGFIIALFTRKKIIWAPRGEMSPDALSFGSGKKRVILWLIKYLKSRMIFHATSPAEEENIRNQFGKCKVTLIPNGIEIRPPITPTTPHQDLIFLGRIHPIKGLTNLIEALSISKEFQKSGKRLILAGAPERGYEKALETQTQRLHLENKVEFIGKIDGHTKQDWLAGAYCLILPSLSENFGAVIAEALAQGTPCIASTGTPWKILPEQNAGEYVDNDPQSLAEAIDRMLRLSPEAHAQMRKRALELAQKVLDINNYIPQWTALLKS